jgi:hypothetical protein
MHIPIHTNIFSNMIINKKKKRKNIIKNSNFTFSLLTQNKTEIRSSLLKKKKQSLKIKVSSGI